MWAQERCVLLAEDYFVGLEKYEKETTEHEVFYRRSDERAVKRTRPGRYGLAVGSQGKHRAATPSLYFERLQLMNQVFSTDVGLEGIYILRDSPEPSIVTSQNWIQARDEKAPYPSEQEISAFMNSLGFVLLENAITKWRRESDQIIVSDAREHNFINSVHGVFPVDLLINRLIICD